jgi:hypothetical protein
VSDPNSRLIRRLLEGPWNPESVALQLFFGAQARTYYVGGIARAGSRVFIIESKWLKTESKLETGRCDENHCQFLMAQLLSWSYRLVWPPSQARQE